MDFHALFSTDAVQEQTGRPFTDEFGGECTMLIARAQNRSYTRMSAKLFEQHQHILSLKDTDAAEERAEELNFELMGKIIAKTILLGWSGNVQYKGQPLPYSYENALLLLSMKDFRAKVMSLANNFRNFLLKQEADDAKNSAPISSGISPGEAALSS